MNSDGVKCDGCGAGLRVRQQRAGARRRVVGCPCCGAPVVLRRAPVRAHELVAADPEIEIAVAGDNGAPGRRDPAPLGTGGPAASGTYAARDPAPPGGAALPTFDGERLLAALTRVGTLDEARARLADLSALLAISKKLNTEKDLDALLHVIMDETTRLLQADRSSLFLYDAATKEIFTKIAQRAEVKEIRLPVGTGISGRVAASGQTLNIPDAYDTDFFDRSWDAKTGYRTRSVLCMPMYTREGELQGVVQVLNKHGGLVGARFDETDEALLGVLGSHAAHALANARLIQAYLEGQKMKKSLEVARDIQKQLLPAADPRVPGFDISGYTLSADETGGDYFDYIPLPEGRLAIAVGDVTGHGVGAALLMATARAQLRAFIAQRTEVCASFRYLNNALEQDGPEDRFMTLLAGVLDLNAARWHYVSAGHDPPYWYHAADDTFTEMESTGLPLGMMPDQEYELGGPHQFAPGDLVALCTDGVWEAMNGADEEYGQDRLKALIRRCRDRSASQIIDALYADVTGFCAGTPLRDDFTIVIVKVLAGAAPTPAAG